MTANQIVAFNVVKARLLRGWTQEEAADAIAPYLGNRLSAASFSAIERSVDVGRVREFSAHEILAFARGFHVPVTWFFTPPSPYWDGVGVDTPDAGEDGLDPLVVLDAVLGTPATLEEYRQYLFSWPSDEHRLRVYADGTAEDLGAISEDVHPRLDELLRIRARRHLRDRFGDVDGARDALTRLLGLLDALDDPATETSPQQRPNRGKTSNRQTK